MRSFATLILLATGAPLLSGCALAVLPVIAAGGTIGRQQIDKREAEKPSPSPAPATEASNVQSAPTEQNAPPVANLAGASQVPVPASEASPILVSQTAQVTAEASLVSPVAPVAATDAPASIEDVEVGPAFAPLVAFVDAQIEKQRAAILPESVVPVRDVSLTDPKYLACGGQPNAVIIDLDREGGALARESRVVAPGFAASISAIRAKGVKIIWLTEAQQESYTALRAELESTGLVPEGQDEILFPASRKSRKQTLRLEAASRHCVLAMAGDKRGDFDELFDYLIDPGNAILLERNFGSGWFIVPPPFALAQKEGAHDGQ